MRQSRPAGLVPFVLTFALLAPVHAQGLDEDVGLAGTTAIPTPGARNDVPLGAASSGDFVLIAGTAFGDGGPESNPFLLAVDGDGVEEWSWIGLEQGGALGDFVAAPAGTGAVLAVRFGLTGERVVRIEDGVEVWSTQVDSPGTASSSQLQLAASADGQRVFVLSYGSFQQDFLIALDGADGSILWVRETTQGMNPVSLDCDAAGSVAVVTLEAPNAAFQDRAIAYEGASGSVRFVANLAGYLENGVLRALRVEPNGERAFVGSEPKPGSTVDLVGFELQSGGLLWSAALGESIAALEFDAAGPNLIVASEELVNFATANVTLHSVRPALGVAQWNRPLAVPRNRTRSLKLGVDAAGVRGVLHYDSTPPLPFGDDTRSTTLASFSVFDGAELWESTVEYPADVGDLSDGTFLATDQGPLVVSARSAELPGGPTADLLVTARGADNGTVGWELVRAFDAVKPQAEALLAPKDAAVVFATVLDAGSDRQLVALDPATQAVLWSADAGEGFQEFSNFGPGSPLAASSDGSTAFHIAEPSGGSQSQILRAFDGATGDLLWFDNLSGESLGEGVDLELAEAPAGDTLVSLHPQTFKVDMRASTTAGDLLWRFGYPTSSSGFVSWGAGALELDPVNGRALALLHKSFPERQLIVLVRDLQTGLLQTSIVLDEEAFVPGANLGSSRAYDLKLSVDGSAAFLVGDFDSQPEVPARLVAARVDPASGAIAWTAALTPLPDVRYRRGESMLAEPAGALVVIAETDGEADQQQVVLAGLDVNDGASLWTQIHGGPGDPRTFLDAEAAPGGRQVLVSLGRPDGVPQVIALDAATGAELWSAELPSVSSGDLARTLAARDGSVFALVGSTVSIVDGSATLFELEPEALVAGPQALSVGVPEPLVFAIDRPDASAGSIHLLLGSLTTSSPGLPVDGQFLPLALDGYLLTTLSQAGQGAFAQTVGLLDDAGRARVEIDVPAGLPPALVGTERFHAFLEFDPQSGLATFASEAIGVTFVP